MDFTLTKEQQDIQQAAREFALGEFPKKMKNKVLQNYEWNNGRADEQGVYPQLT